MSLTPTEVLEYLADSVNLTYESMIQAMTDIMRGCWTDHQICAFLMGLRTKGETVTEIAAAANVMRQFAVQVPLSQSGVIDTCGTGGDGADLFNISTAVSFVVSAAGGFVAKHGNRSQSSRTGAADVLEAAGVYLEITPAQAARCIESLGVGFLFAPLHHSAMKHAMPARRALGIRTLFNVLGPLTNPAGVKRQLLGVFDRRWVLPIARVLQSLGSEKAIVVCSEDGLDEFSISGVSHYALLDQGQITEGQLRPEDVNLTSAPLTDLQVSSPEESLAMIERVFKKEPNLVSDPARDIVALNAGVALYVADIVGTIGHGVELAQDILASGAAGEKLKSLVSMTSVFRVENNAE